MTQTRTDSKLLGILLIGGGILLLADQWNWIAGDFFLFYLSLGFLIAYAARGGATYYGNIGFLIPALMIFAVNLFANLEETGVVDYLGGGTFFLFIGLAFYGVYLHTRRFTNIPHSSRNWPLLTSKIILGFGIVILILEHISEPWRVENPNLFWAVVLIALGVFLLAKGWRKQRSVNVDSDGQKGRK